MSLAGFQSISKRRSLEAPIRFSPTPPALELNRNTTEAQKAKQTCRKWVYEINVFQSSLPTEKLGKVYIVAFFSQNLAQIMRRKAPDLQGLGRDLGAAPIPIVHTALLRSLLTMLWRTNPRLTEREKNGREKSNLFGSRHVFIYAY